jgi:hypothetical protein
VSAPIDGSVEGEVVVSAPLPRLSVLETPASPLWDGMVMLVLRIA